MREQMEGMLRSGEAESVLRMIREYFDAAPPPSPDAQWKAITAMRAAADLKAWGQVLDWGDRARSLGRKDREASGWIDLFRGTAHMYLGNVYEADRALASFRRISRGVPALQWLIPYGLYNWATLMRFMRRHSDESLRFREAARGFTKLGCTDRMLQCHLAVAWSSLLQGLVEPAAVELHFVSAHLAQCDSAEVQVNHELARALYESLQGNMAESDRICQALLERVDLLEGQRADAIWILGSNCRARGDMDLALRHADEAHALASRDFWPLQIERIDALKRRAVAN